MSRVRLSDPPTPPRRCEQNTLRVHKLFVVRRHPRRLHVPPVRRWSGMYVLPQVASRWPWVQVRGARCSSQRCFVSPRRFGATCAGSWGTLAARNPWSAAGFSAVVRCPPPAVLTWLRELHLLTRLVSVTCRAVLPSKVPACCLLGPGRNGAGEQDASPARLLVTRVLDVQAECEGPGTTPTLGVGHVGSRWLVAVASARGITPPPCLATSLHTHTQGVRKCVECPRAFHASARCTPADAVVLSRKRVLCSQHEMSRALAQRQQELATGQVYRTWGAVGVRACA